MRSTTIVLAASVAAGTFLHAQTIDSATFGAMEARALGPAVTSGRVTSIDGVASDPKVLYVGAANGGVWKTANGGTSFKPVFDKYTQSIGAITIDQAKPETVWVGTGEAWVRNSTSVGTGIYKTKDGGDNWQLMGLPKSERIGKIVIDPKNSDVVYVAVLGALWNASEDRGLYKTTDGGATWKKILYVDADTGCTDVVIDPQETSIVYASTWQFRRYPWKFESGGAGSGIHRSTDGGATWEQVKEGLPQEKLGRIALALAAGRPGTVYAAVESTKSGFYRSDDAGRSWKRESTQPPIGMRPFYFMTLVPDPKDYQKIYKPGMLSIVSKDGGKTWTNFGNATHSDHHTMWIDPTNTSTMYLGTDGGVYRSNDNGVTWNFLRGLPLAQFYHISFDMEHPYNVYGGLQDNGSWGAPSASKAGEVLNKDWTNVGFGDGFYVWAHPTDKDVLYSQYQGGHLLRYTKSTGELKAIKPLEKPGDPKYRFNWNAATALSATDPNAFYAGAQYVFRSKDRGESWERLSPDLTTNDPAKQKQEASGGITVDNSDAENHCTVVAIAESPLDGKVIWAGTDDGNLQVTRDGGKNWKNVVANVPGLPKNTWVSRVEPSHFAAGRAYASFDGHQTGDMATYLYRTDDFGATWTRLGGAGVTGFAHVIREDLVKENLLFAGTEFGLFLTINGGKQWAQFTGNLPGVAVRDVKIHPREHDLIIATHGRGVYVLDDITPIRKLTPDVLSAPLTVLEGAPNKIRFSGMVQDFSSSDEFSGRNPQDAAFITYYLRDRAMTGDFYVEVFDAENRLITKMPAGKRRGINRVPFAMRLKPPKVPPSAALEGGSLQGPMLPEGVYTAKIHKGEELYLAKIELVGDPRLPHTAADRKAQQETAMKLYRELERLAFIAAQVTDSRDQLRAADAKSALAGKLDEFHKTLVATSENRLSGEVRLREQIGELYGEVSRYGGRPTKSQVDRVGVLTGLIDKAGAEYEALMKGDPAGAGVKRLTRAEFDKRQ